MVDPTQDFAKKGSYPAPDFQGSVREIVLSNGGKIRFLPGDAGTRLGFGVFIGDRGMAVKMERTEVETLRGMLDLALGGGNGSS